VLTPSGVSAIHFAAGLLGSFNLDASSFRGGSGGGGGICLWPNLTSVGRVALGLAAPFLLLLSLTVLGVGLQLWHRLRARCAAMETPTATADAVSVVPVWRLDGVFTGSLIMVAMISYAAVLKVRHT
jgi:hypothetical protein